MNIRALPTIILLGLCFGSSMVVSRFSVGQLEPASYIAIRMLMASLMSLLVYAIITGRRVPRDLTLWRRAGLLGVFGTAVPMTTVVTALQYQSSGVTSLLLTTGPAITIALAHFILPDELLNRRKVIGVTLALSGALLLALSGENGLPDVAQADPRGYLLVTLAMISSSIMVIYARKTLRGYRAFDVGSVRLFSTAIVMLPYSLLTVGLDFSRVDGAGVAALIYAAVVGTFLGFMLSFYSIKRFGATPTVMTTYVIPIVAGVGGVLLLGEEITSTMVVGMIVIAGGIALLQEYKKPAGVLRRYPHRGSY
ncbi:MAG: DMT family transporter [Chloroflexi bacterium]|nr:DMT family transporter [Chloroflexota bacterium]